MKVTSYYEKNVTAFCDKQIRAVHLPTTYAELCDLVAQAHRDRRALYTISRGKNWGLGSRQPIKAGASVVDLQKLNGILEVNARFRYAIIEPGVTQAQLSTYLLAHHPDLIFPVTGSACQTSIVGNLLERGSAFFAHRNKTLVALEVLLADGKVVRTGFWHYFETNHPLAFHYPAGHGPDLRGLFTQSNMGIVTKMVVRLQPKRAGKIIIMRFKETLLAQVIDTLRQQYEQGLLDDGIVITNENDPRTATKANYTYSGKWVVLASTSPHAALLQPTLAAIKGAYRSLAVSLTCFSTSGKEWKQKLPGYLHRLPLLERLTRGLWQRYGRSSQEISALLSTLIGYHGGIPSDYSIQTMAAINGSTLNDDELDHSAVCGLSIALPAVPFEGQSVLEVQALISEVSARLAVHPFFNLGSIDELTFEGFYRIYFDRNDPIAVQTAHRWRTETLLALRKQGYYPYRIDNESMSHYSNSSDPYWQTIAAIKHTLDPHNIFSAGKYDGQA